jgi:hypothetical protein
LKEDMGITIQEIGEHTGERSDHAAAASKRRKSMATSNKHKWFDTSNIEKVAHALNIQITLYVQKDVNEMKAYLNARDRLFSGLPVVALLFRINHFLVISIKPFIADGLVGKDGRGLKGKDIPEFIDIVFIAREKSMPYLNMCMLCKKWILSD